MVYGIFGKTQPYRMGKLITTQLQHMIRVMIQIFLTGDCTEFEKLQPLAPSECTIIVDLDASGNVLVLGENVAEVVPDAPSAGYHSPQYSG